MTDVGIIGGGIFGSVAAALLRRAGMTVDIIDDRRPGSGSAAAGCLMKPGWLSALGKKGTDEALQTLDELYGVRTLEFNIGNLFWVKPYDIMGQGSINGKVNVVSGTELVIHGPTGLVWATKYKTIIVAAGAWTGKLLPEVQVTAKMGASLRWNTPGLSNRVSVWAPYKQLVSMSAEDFHWAGDGSAILEKNWTPARAAETVDRIRGFVYHKPGFHVTEGARPFCDTEGAPALLKEVRPGVWALTGGAKIGTAAAAWAAKELLRRLS